jgi:hypothetical protein
MSDTRGRRGQARKRPPRPDRDLPSWYCIDRRQRSSPALLRRRCQGHRGRGARVHPGARGRRHVLRGGPGEPAEDVQGRMAPEARARRATPPPLLCSPPAAAPGCAGQPSPPRERSHSSPRPPCVLRAQLQASIVTLQPAPLPLPRPTLHTRSAPPPHPLRPPAERARAASSSCVPRCMAQATRCLSCRRRRAPELLGVGLWGAGGRRTPRAQSQHAHPSAN